MYVCISFWLLFALAYIEQHCSDLQVWAVQLALSVAGQRPAHWQWPSVGSAAEADYAFISLPHPEGLSAHYERDERPFHEAAGAWVGGCSRRCVRCAGASQSEHNWCHLWWVRFNSTQLNSSQYSIVIRAHLLQRRRWALVWTALRDDHRRLWAPSTASVTSSPSASSRCLSAPTASSSAPGYTSNSSRHWWRCALSSLRLASDGSLPKATDSSIFHLFA